MTGLRTRMPAYVSAYSYVRMQVWHTHGRTRLQKKGRIWFTCIIRQGRTQERGLQVRPAIRKAEGGGGGGVRPFIHPSTVYLLNGEGDLALGKGSINPHLLPLRRIRHVVTQSYVLLFLIMCAYGLAVYNVK